MRHTRNYRPPFDHRSEFVYSRALKVSGVPVIAGEQVDKSKFDGRRLRQLYEQRQIQYAPGDGPRKPEPKPLAVGPTDLKNPGKVGQPVAQPEKARKRVARKRLTRAA